MTRYCNVHEGDGEPLYCVFCHFTAEDVVNAFTVMNGHAVCQDHAEHGSVQGGGTFTEILMYLRRNERVTP